MNGSVSDQSRTAFPLCLQSAKHLSAQRADMKVKQKEVFVLWGLWLSCSNHHLGLFQDHYVSLWQNNQTFSIRKVILLLMKSNFWWYLLPYNKTICGTRICKSILKSMQMFVLFLEQIVLLYESHSPDKSSNILFQDVKRQKWCLNC